MQLFSKRLGTATAQFLPLSVLFICTVCAVSAENIKGSLQLNSGTFDKVVTKFKAALIKFDKSHAFGPKHAEFRKVAEACLAQSDLVIGEVGIQDYGSKENSDLAERYGVKSSEYPEYRLFINGDLTKPVEYTGDESKADEIQRFIIKYTGLWIGLPGCIKEFDVLAKRFLASPSSKDRLATLNEARAARDRLSPDDSSRQPASIYVKTMEKVLELGDDFIDAELERVERLSDGKVSERKKNQLKDRASILTSFSMHVRDEL